MAMKTSNEQFSKRIDKAVDDSFMRGAVAAAQERLRTRKQEKMEELGNWEDWRSLSAEIRDHVLENLDYYLNELSENVSKKGGHVFFAKTAEDATGYIGDVIKKKDAKKIVKAKSMVTEEINLNHTLEALGCEVVESDLGEYILQVDDNDPPSHIVVPALHKNKEQIRQVFADKQGYDKSSNSEELAAHARKMLRADFLAAEVGITGCNFAIAESGAITLVTNEGNADMVANLPKTQIVVMGMERIVPTLEEMEVLVSMLTVSAVGQILTSYITVLNGPQEEGSADGPEDFHLVIVDNGRSGILASEFREVLRCIRCAACVNVCPVYRHIGGQSYGSIYSGPIGAVLSPLLGGYDDYKELPYASSLCGACTEACPVQIPLHDMLIRHRQIIVEREGKAPFAEKMLMKGFGLGASSPVLFKMATKYAHGIASPFAKDDKIEKGPGPLKGWTQSRDFPSPSKNTFREWFKNHEKGGK